MRRLRVAALGDRSNVYFCQSAEAISYRVRLIRRASDNDRLATRRLYFSGDKPTMFQRYSYLKLMTLAAMCVATVLLSQSVATALTFELIHTFDDPTPTGSIDGAFGDHFGLSMSLDGETVLIGAPWMQPME